jgi:cysteine dioxygenase
MKSSLEALWNYLDGLDGRAPLQELTDRLADAAITWEDVADYIRFSDRQYMRNLVRSGSWYYALVLCWKNGQRSPIHNHTGSTCGVRVLRGTLTETVFEFAPNGAVKATVSRDCLPGSILGSVDGDMHQVSNLQAGDADLVTLHVYSPPLLFMETFSLTDRSRGQEPMLLEFSDAAGI